MGDELRTGRSQITKGLESHGKEFLFYSWCTAEALKHFKPGIDKI